MASPLLFLRSSNRAKIELNLDHDLPSWASFARASTGNRYNASGVVESIASGLPRFDYNPSTLASRGLLIEPQRTNYFVSSASPSAWTSSGTINGLTYTRSATGTENGIAYGDYTITGTATGTYVDFFGILGGSSRTTASTGQSWTISGFVKLLSGIAPSRVSVQIIEEDTSTTYLRQNGVNAFTLDGTRSYSQNTSVMGSSVGNVRGAYIIDIISGTTYSFVLRLYEPQLECGASATSLIHTSGAAATRAADQLSFTLLGGVTRLRYIFDDGSFQDVSVSSGAYAVPTTLNRTWIQKIKAYAA